MEVKKVQKKGRDERTQEDYPPSAVYFCRCRVVFLHSFISALFLYFFQLHPYLKSSFTETFSLVFLGMGQVQNGCLYIRYRSNSQKNQAELGVKKLTDHAHPFAKSTLKLH